MQLRPSPKTAGLSRTVAPEETARRVRSLARRLGVTRLSELTGLDYVGIPTFAAIVPDSDDAISVYTGKGVRRADARAGALMEAIERQSALRARPPLIQARFAELRARAPTVDPRSLVTALAEDYSEHGVYDWVEGYDLINDCATFVPAPAAGYRWRHLEHPSPLRGSTTHGLSAGNCLEETVSQALCEWVERDAWTLAEIACHWRPRAVLEALTRRDPGIDFIDDLECQPCLCLDGIGDPVDGLLARFRAAGLQPVVRSLTSDLGIAVVLASVAADDGPGPPQVHMGLGAHPDLRVAACRALTETAQSRCGDIQGVREDLEPADGTSATGHTRRVAFIDRRRWIVGRSSSLQHWREVPDHRHEDIVDDIRLILTRLGGAGIRQAVIVDLSPPECGVVVLRAVIPGLETWVIDHGRLGERAASRFRATGARAAHA